MGKVRINFNKSCKLHECCSDNEYHFVLEYIYFHDGKAVASDSYIIIEVPIDEICNFSEEQKNILNGKYIHNEQFKEILKYDIAEVREDGIMCKKSFTWNENKILNETMFKFSDMDLKYPKYENVIPKINKPLRSIGIKSNLLKKMCDSIGKYEVELCFSSSMEAIKVKFKESEAVGVIMPIRTPL